jgi:spermidine synthase
VDNQRFRTELKNVTGRLLRACTVLCALVFGFAFADKLTYWGEHGLFGDEIVFATTTPYQRLVITAGRTICACTSTATCSSPRATSTATTKRWCIRCCSAAVGQARAGAGRRRRPGAARNPALSEYRTRHAGGPRPGHDGRFHQREELVKLNHGSFSDKRVRVVNADAAIWLQHNDDMFDAAIVDFPIRPASRWASCIRCRSTAW